jgi:hypothetical protein
LGNVFSLIAAATFFFEVVGPTIPWVKTAGQSARPQAHAVIENVPRSQPFVFNRILPQGRAFVAAKT